MTHTPGPWTATPSPHDKRVYLIDSKANGAVGELIYIDTRKEADARLIAAAPDLLEALHAIRLCEFNSMSSRQEMMRLAKAAIAKATGAADV